MARALGVPGRPLSPTFTLVNEYRGTRPVYHVDAYRTESVAELLELGLEEYFDGEGVTLIEWADKMRPLLPAAHDLRPDRGRGRRAAHDHRSPAGRVALEPVMSPSGGVTGQRR